MENFVKFIGIGILCKGFWTLPGILETKPSLFLWIPCDHPTTFVCKVGDTAEDLEGGEVVNFLYV